MFTLILTLKQVSSYPTQAGDGYSVTVMGNHPGPTQSYFFSPPHRWAFLCVQKLIPAHNISQHRSGRP